MRFFGGADHRWQDIGLEGRAWTLSEAVFWIGWATRRGDRCVRSTCRADRSWRSQEYCAYVGAACVRRIRSIALLHCGPGLETELRSANCSGTRPRHTFSTWTNTLHALAGRPRTWLENRGFAVRAPKLFELFHDVSHRGAILNKLDRQRHDVLSLVLRRFN